MNSAFYQAIFATRISSKRDTVADFETTQGGFRFSTSVGGGFTGRGADVIVIDDPLKADEALSDARRESVNEWFDNTLRSRLNRQEHGAIIIIMQRLHINDLVAHVQETENWRVLSFSAIAETDELHEVRSAYGTTRLRRKRRRHSPTVLDLAPDSGNASNDYDILPFCCPVSAKSAAARG